MDRSVLAASAPMVGPVVATRPEMGLAGAIETETPPPSWSRWSDDWGEGPSAPPLLTGRRPIAAEAVETGENSVPLEGSR